MDVSPKHGALHCIAAIARDIMPQSALYLALTRPPRRREYFQKDLNDHIDPDITVAVGAASILD